MKTAYLLGSLNRGGTETLILDICRNADKAAFEMIGIYRKEGQLSDEFKKTKIPFFNLRPSGFRYFFRLRKLLKTQNIRVVHAQQPIDMLYARIACFFTGIKRVMTFHSFPEDRFFPWLINTLAIKWSDSIIFVSQYQKEFYQKHYRLKNSNRLVVVHNGISFDKLNNYTYSSIRKELGIPSDILLIGSVGNFVPGREPMTIFRFLYLLKQNRIPFHFIFAGKRSDTQPQIYDDCVEFCNKNGLTDCVSFLGSRSDIPNILGQLDAFVYSSDHDTFGIAVIEAIAAGIPVFVNNWNVMNEITNRGEFATIYKTKNENDLFAQFMLFLQDKEHYNIKALKASASVRDLFSIDRHIHMLEDLYSNI